MDFLDFPALVVDEAAALPQPASRLSLASLRLNDDEQEAKFVLPNVSKHDTEFTDLHSKMKHFASISLGEIRPASASLSNEVAAPVSSNIEKPTTTNQLLSKKINNLVNVPNYASYTSDSEIKRALQILEENHSDLGLNFNQLVASDFVGTLNRKSLRSKLENSMLNSHSDILSNFQSIARRIKRLSGPLERINNAMQNFTDTPESKDFEFEHVKDRLDQLKARRQVIIKLRDSLTLTQLELDHLQNGTINDLFFQILNKINFIKEKATYLLSNEKTTSAGMALLKTMNNNLTVSNKRIYNYLINFIEEYDTLSRQYGERTIGDESLTNFQTSLIHLSNDVQFFQDFLNRIVGLRSKRLLDEFLSQFDIDNKKLQRPIILSAHDPVRYLGDVLAYVHSMIVNELEFLKSTFKLKSELVTSDSVLKDNMDFIGDLHLKLLNEIFTSLANTIRIRLEQIVRFENNPMLNLDIVQCLSLYQMMLVKNGINESSQLMTSLNDLENLARSKIVSSVTLYLKDLDKNQIAATDLLPPDWFVDYLSKLSQLLNKLEQQNETRILTDDLYDKLILDPINNNLVSNLQNWFPTAKKEKSARIDLLIVQINSFDLVKSKLGPFHSTIFSSDYGKGVFSKLETQYASCVTKLKETMNSYLFESTGMELYFNLFNMIFPILSVQDELDYDMYLSAVENPIMKLAVIHDNIHEKLNDYLPLAVSDFQDVKLFNLMPPAVEEDIVSTCFGSFIKFYEVFKSVLNRLYPEDEEMIMSTLNFTTNEVSTLLGVEDK
ncbi:Cog6 [Kluyveromyces lactis]|nr:Cog6 [Kluyveromyces lactis]